MDVREIIKLNVGGVKFQTTKSTLLVDCCSRLYDMFCDEANPVGHEEVFIDRDGSHFKYILNYLRTGRLVVPQDTMILNELLVEAQYYRVTGVLEGLSKPCYQIKGISTHIFGDEVFAESAILRDENNRKTLHGWLGGGTRQYMLLYRASRDGWDADSFHCLCDNKGATVIVARKGSSVFGGYTEQSWAGNCSKLDKNAFLYSLVNPSASVGPIKLPICEGEEEDAISCHPNDGPVFGKGRDLAISANRSNCSSRLGNTYQCPANQIPTLFLAGTLSFTISDFEVYGVS